MRDYSIEDANHDPYKNGVFVFRQDTPSGGIGAFSHIHTAIEIIYLTQGSLVVETDDIKYNVFAGDVLLFRSNTIHHIIAGKDAFNIYYVVKIRPEIIFDLAEEENHGSYLLDFTVNSADSRCLWTREEVESSPLMKQGLNMLVNLVEQSRELGDLAAKLGAGLVLMSMLGGIETKGNNGVNRDIASGIYRVMSYINRHYSDDISEKQMSELAGISRSHFSRSFKTVTGKTYNEYLNMTRINRAEHLLATTDKTVTQICTDCGFNSTSYFVKIFKKYKLLPPMAYKRKEKYQEYEDSNIIRYGKAQ